MAEMDSATGVFYTLFVVLVGAVIMALARGVLVVVGSLAGGAYKATIGAEAVAVLQPAAAAVKPLLESVFGKLSEVKVTMDHVLLASILFVLVGCWSSMAAAASAARTKKADRADAPAAAGAKGRKGE